MSSEIAPARATTVVDLGVLSLAFAYFMSQFFRSFLAVLYPSLSRDLGLDAAALSSAAGAWFLAFAFAQFPIGWALDRYGPRMTAPTAFGSGAGGGALWLAFAGSPAEVTAAMVAIGAGCAPVLMAALWLFARTRAPARFATLSATLIAVGSLGNVLAAEPFARLVEAIGWREATACLAAASAAIAVAAAVFLPPAPPRVAAAERKADGGLMAVLAIRGLWAYYPLMLVSYAVVANLRGVWIGPHLAQVYGYDGVEIGRASTYMAVAMAVGVLAIGPLDRAFGTRKGVNLAFNAAVLGMVLVLALTPAPSDTTVIALYAVIGFFGLSFPMMMAHGRAFVPAALTGRGITLFNFFSLGGVGLMQAASGALYAARVPEGAVAGAADFSALHLFYAGALALGLVVYLFCEDKPPER